MKKNLIYAVLLILGFTACRKTEVEEVFYTSPEGRMNDTLAFLRKELTAAPYGWKSGLTTGLKGGYGFYMQFDADQNVTMLSDYSTTSGTDVKKSTYRVSPTNLPSLVFDTYNYISILQDPVPSVAGGAAGQGLRSDIEFSYIGKNGDSLFFIGRKYELPLTLVKAKQPEQQAFLAGGINTYKTGFTNTFNSNYTFAYLSAGQNGNMAVELDYTGKVIKFTSVNAAGEVVGSRTAPFYYTAGDVSLVWGGFVPFNAKVIKALKYEGNKVLAIFTDGSTQEILSQTTPLYKFELVFDYNKNFKKIVSGDAIPGIIANVHIFDRVKQLFTASTRTITEMYFGFNNSTTAIFTIRYVNSSNSAFTASAIYQYRREGNKLWLKRVGIDGGNNWTTRATEVAPVNDLFGNGDEREFVLDWVPSSSSTVKFPVGAIKSVTNLNNMLYGRLGE